MAEKRLPKLVSRTLRLRNMTGPCCVHLVRRILDADGIILDEVRPGLVRLRHDPGKITMKTIEKILNGYGFEIIRDREEILAEEIRLAVTEMVHHTTYNAMVRNSDFLVERFSMSYPYLSGVFSRHYNMTLEKFIIQLRIEKVQELIGYGELTLSEIAYMMGYSSVQYLSTQFRAVTGISVTEFRKGDVSSARQDESTNYYPFPT